MAITKFFLICRRCFDKMIKNREGDLCVAGKTNIHSTGKHFIFSCLNCNEEEIFVPDIITSGVLPTKKQMELLNEKKEIELKLQNLIN